MQANQVFIEFTGVSRILTGKTECVFSIGDTDDVEEIVRKLGMAFPALVGEVIEKNGGSLIPTNLFSVNGARILHEDEMQYKPKDGDRLILLSLLAGG